MALKIGNLAEKALGALKKEQDILHTVHPEVQAALRRVEDQHPGLRGFLGDARGYVVFPSIGKAAIALGVAFGKGEVFEKRKLIGYAGIVQVTLGVQVGGETFTEIIAFENKAALERFKEGKLKFSANASVALVKAGAAVSARYEKGVAVMVYSEGGLMLEAALGAQKFVYYPAVLGRGRKPRRAVGRKSAGRLKVKKARGRAVSGRR